MSLFQIELEAATWLDSDSDDDERKKTTTATSTAAIDEPRPSTSTALESPPIEGAVGGHDWNLETKSCWIQKINRRLKIVREFKHFGFVTVNREVNQPLFNTLVN